MSEYKVGSVIQIMPKHEWGGCLATIIEIKSYGCSACVRIPLRGDAFINLNKGEYTYIGESVCTDS